MSKDCEVIMAPALTFPNHYYIFRDTGEQVTVKVVNGKWHPDRMLSKQEKIYLNNNLFKND